MPILPDIGSVGKKEPVRLIGCSETTFSNIMILINLVLYF